jgi:hypothetical protein
VQGVLSPYPSAIFNELTKNMNNISKPEYFSAKILGYTLTKCVLFSFLGLFGAGLGHKEKLLWDLQSLSYANRTTEYPTIRADIVQEGTLKPRVTHMYTSIPAFAA